MEHESTEDGTDGNGHVPLDKLIETLRANCAVDAEGVVTRSHAERQRLENINTLSTLNELFTFVHQPSSSESQLLLHHHLTSSPLLNRCMSDIDQVLSALRNSSSNAPQQPPLLLLSVDSMITNHFGIHSTMSSSSSN